VEGPSGDPTCSDGIDNDQDGLTDSDDPDCAPPPPAVEGPSGDPTCSDGIDNDQDGLTDDDDPDCAPPPTASEGPPGDPSCSDSIDNDGDGLMDLNDPGCIAAGNRPPDCGAAEASVRKLWPVDHALHDVTVGGVTDADGDPVALTIISVMQDEPANGTGDGNSCPDAEITGDDTVSLRAERSGITDGRVYHVNFMAEDGLGGSCTGEVTVCVPHNRKTRRGCIDQGPLFDSTSHCAAAPTKVKKRNFSRTQRSGRP